MAKKLDPKNLTIDYKKLRRMTVADRVDMLQAAGEALYSSLTPTQLANLFPRFYLRSLPDIGKAVTGASTGGSSGASTGTGSAGSTATPQPKTKLSPK